MSKKRGLKKKQKTLKSILFFLSILILTGTSIYLYQKNTDQEIILKEKSEKVKIREEQEQFVKDHKEDLNTIKTLKQEILGQQHKLEEYQNQIANFTDQLIKNKEKLEELES